MWIHRRGTGSIQGEWTLCYNDLLTINCSWARLGRWVLYIYLRVRGLSPLRLSRNWMHNSASVCYTDPVGLLKKKESTNRNKIIFAEKKETAQRKFITDPCTDGILNVKKKIVPFTVNRCRKEVRKTHAR